MILIDNGHGADTPGKRSPDSSLLEWEWTRLLAADLKTLLSSAGVAAVQLTPEEADVPLSVRAARANAIADARLLVSLHVNAAGMGEWRSARGWSAHVAPEASAHSRRAASLLAQAVESAGISVRRPQPGVDYWTQPLAICRLTRCPAVLTENLFMDNPLDLALLRSQSFRLKLASAHAQAIINFLSNHSL